MRRSEVVLVQPETLTRRVFHLTLLRVFTDTALPLSQIRPRETRQR